MYSIFITCRRRTRGNEQYNKNTVQALFYVSFMWWSTCRYLVCVTTGTQCRLLVLQQPEQRCTSTQGGHNMKLALLRSNMALVTSTTSVRTLHRACWAGWASEGPDYMIVCKYDGQYLCISIQTYCLHTIKNDLPVVYVFLKPISKRQQLNSHTEICYRFQMGGVTLHFKENPPKEM